MRPSDTTANQSKSPGEQRPALPSISLPKGGGAIRGMGEKFTTNPVTGTGSLTVPLATSPGRSGFGPQLSIAYDSGSGNGPFGFGWTLSIPSVTRKTDKGLPQYRDTEESDVFILSGAEDLVPVLDGSGRRYRDENTVPGYIIHRYRPRTEGLFARIERWTRTSDGDVHWRSISKDNILTLYGKNNDSRITDAQDPIHDSQNAPRVFSWLICETRDDKGNAILYEYKREDGTGIDLSLAPERNRGDRDDPRRATNRYLKRIRYGNRVPLLDTAGQRPRFLIDAQIQNAGWMFEVVFDYGEHDQRVPKPSDTGAWKCRADSFSTYRAGFEVRTCRRCRRVMMFHHFKDETDVGNDCLVRSTDFRYGDELNPLDVRNPIYSLLREVIQTGYRRTSTGYLSRSLPPVEFEYRQHNVDDTEQEVDAESLENLPSGLDGAAYQWTDLHGEGISGILVEQNDAWFYKRNLSPINVQPGTGAAHIEAKFAPIELVATKPNLSIAGGPAQFMDLAGDGQPDLVVLDGPVPGLYEHDEAESWKQFRPFTQPLNRDSRDPNLKFVDLDGDGHADVLISENDAFVWHCSRAEEGFGPANRVPQALDEEKGPQLVFADGTQSIYLADLSGDGLTDLVRIRNGEICYWPNLGYGRFGAKVAMDHAPVFDHPDYFDHKRIRLADIDGTGTTDIIYLHRDGVRLYFNQSGNSWSEPQSLDAFPRTDDLATVTATDLLANGTACLVWSSKLPGEARRQMRYVDLMGGQKPLLLIGVKNNLGAETRVHYSTSTKFYLQDKRDGKPWITRLPFPVHVVDRVETYDHISDNRFVSHYAYHHGFFDGEEREFRGFGMVEQRDTEDLADLEQSDEFPPGDNINDASHVPPALTRTWFHTGLYVGRDHVSDFFAGLLDANDRGEYYREPGLTDVQARALLLPDTVLPDSLSLDEEREACRALKGAMLRQEVYALDGTDKAGIPYTVAEQNFTIECLQRRGVNPHAVFFTHAREALSYHYERNPADPRVTHALTLEVDDYGNVLKEVAIGYGRRQSPFSEPKDREKQSTPLITFTESSVTNAIDDVARFPDDYRTPLPAETRVYELTGIVPNANSARFSFDEWSGAGFDLAASLATIPYEQEANRALKQKRLIENVRTRYRRNDLTALLPLRVLEVRALPGQSFQLAFTPGLLASVFTRPVANQPDEVLLPAPATLLEGQGADQGGYVAWDGGWWIPSDRTFFDPAADVTNPALTAAAELATARQQFYLQRKVADPFDHSVLVDFDVHGLLVTRTRDALGNTVAAVNDYRVLQPTLVTDPNRNRTAAAFDALGLVVATAVMGKMGVNFGDLLEGFDADPPLGNLQNFIAQPQTQATSLLGKATTRIVYDLNRYQRAGQPPFAAALSRETHFRDPGGPNSRIQIGFAYSDGFGREIQKKIQAETGDAPQRQAPVPVSAGDIRPGDLIHDPQGELVPANTLHRWVGTGRTVFNNKGKPVRQYEPFFSATHLHESEREMTDTGVSSVVFYDPVLRVVATLHPNHTYDKVVFDAWQQMTCDVNDTVLLDPSDDEDVKRFFVRPDNTLRIPVTEYLPTWHALRTQTAHAAEAADLWPEPTLLGAERDAAQKAAAHADTPTVIHLDALGRPFLTLKDNGPDPVDPSRHLLFADRVELDIEGNQRAVRDAVVQNGDALGRTVMRYDYDMLGNRIRQASMEAGARWMLNDVAGKLIRAWDSRSFLRRMTYDALRRPTGLHVTENGAERLAERTVYGEGQGDSANHRTRAYQVFDGAGILTSVAYDFKGNLQQSRRELLPRYELAVNWDLSPVANDGTFRSETTYDALNRPLTITSPDGSMYRPTFNAANLLERVDVNLRGAAAATPFVTNIDYDAKGQRQLIAYGNGATTTYEYDPLTFRLIHLKTTRTAGLNGLASQIFVQPMVVQDLHYAYDPVGNITRLEDAALQTVVHGGSQAEPIGRYTYDAIYRLILAEGREHIGQSALEFDPANHNYRDHPFVGAGAHPNDLQALRVYTEVYTYDAAGNFDNVRHVAKGGSWTRRYEYLAESFVEPGKHGNRLTKTTVGNGVNHVETYAHDAHGNMTSMPHLPEMIWDFKDQLRQVDLGGGGTAYYVYDAAGQRVRKVIESQHGTRRKERIYLAGFEIYREFGANGTDVELRRETLHVMDDKQRIALVEMLTVENGRPVNPLTPLVRYQFGNHLGSASVELAEDGALISYEEYHPYGTTAFQTGRAAAEMSLKRYRHTGKERDEESGLDYFGARYYASWIGRWSSPDPLMDVDSPNLFAFTRNNPVNLVDPDGRFAYAKNEEEANIVKEALQRDVVKGQGKVSVEPYEDFVKVRTSYGKFMDSHNWETRFGTDVEKRQIGFKVVIKLNDVALPSNAQNGSRTASELLDLALNDPQSRIALYATTKMDKPIGIQWDEKLNPTIWSYDPCESGCAATAVSTSRHPGVIQFEPDPKRYAQSPIPQEPWDKERKEYGLPNDKSLLNVQGVVLFHEIVGHAYGMSLDARNELHAPEPEQYFAILVEDIARGELGLELRRPEKPKGYNNDIGINDLREHAKQFKLPADYFKKNPAGTMDLEQMYQSDLFTKEGFFKEKK